MSVLVIDTETRDPLLKKYGSGAVFKYHFPTVDFEVLCACTFDGIEKKEWLPNQCAEMLEYISKYDTWVMHNAAYDLGVLKYLYRDNLPLETVTIHDNMLIAKLVDQSLHNYSLDILTKVYRVTRKKGESLDDYAWHSGLYQYWHKFTVQRNCHTRPSDNVLHGWCMQNLDKFPLDVVSKYCMDDVIATYALYNHLISIMYEYDLSTLSKIIKICLKSKFRGMRFDKNKAAELSYKWQNIAEQSEIDFRKELGCEDSVNINSVAQIAPLLEQKGVKIPRTDKGNYSMVSDWLDEQNAPIFTNLKRYRKALKADKDYIVKLRKYQEAIPIEFRDDDVGIIFPTMKPLGAKLTGRFSSGGGTGSYELNMLAISGRDKEFGLPMREIFIPNDKDEYFICCDYSAQEPRLQVHFAKILGCDGVDSVIQGYIDDPYMDYHQKVADLTKLDRSTAKTVNLGLAYAMTEWGLAIQLGTTPDEARVVMHQYYKLLPFMKQIQDIAAYALKKNGYIKTIGGRRLYLDREYTNDWGKVKTQERKGLSKLVQGSAADQTMQAMIDADEAGIDIVLVIHDEILASTKFPERDLMVLASCMENAYKFVIPFVAEGGIGISWLESKP